MTNKRPTDTSFIDKQ